MAGWAFVNVDLASGSGPTGSVQYHVEGRGVSGSEQFMFHTASVHGYAANTLVLTGALVVSGAISASSYTIKDITHIDVSGSTRFGDDAGDSHIFTGSLYVSNTSSLSSIAVSSSISGSSTLQAVGATTLGGTLGVSGNVGIGTATPGGPLHVYKAAANQDHTPMELLRLEQQDEGVDMAAGHGPAITFYVGETAGSDHGGSVAVVREEQGDADSAAAMSFYTAADDSAPTEKMRVTSTGKVGIGTTSPTDTLTVVGTVSGSSTLQAVGATTLGGALNVSGASTLKGAISGASTLQAVGATVLGGALNVSGAVTMAGGQSLIYGNANAKITNNGTNLDINSPGLINLNAGNPAIVSSSDGLQIVSDSIFGGRLKVSGASTLKGAISGASTLQAVGATVLGGALNVSGAVTMAGGNALIYGNANAKITNNGTNLDINSPGLINLNAGNPAIVSSSDGLQIVSDSIFGGKLQVSGAQSWAAKVSSSAGAEIVGNSIFVGNLATSGTFTSKGDTQLAAAGVGTTVNGDLTVAQPATFQDSISGSSTLQMVGASIFGNNLSVSGTFTSKGDTQLAAAGVGTTVNGDLTVDQGATFSSTLTLAGKLSSSAAMEVVGATVLGGALNVSGTVTMAGGQSLIYGNANAKITNNGTNLDINSPGLINLNAGNPAIVSSSDGLQIVSDSIFGGKLNVSGAMVVAGISGSSTLQAVGATTLGGALNVSGASTFKGAISGASTLQAVGATVLGGALNVSGTVTMAGGQSLIYGNANAKITNNGTNLDINSPGLINLNAGNPAIVSSSDGLQIVSDSIFGGNLDVSGGMSIGASSANQVNVKAAIAFAGPEAHKLGTITAAAELTASTSRSYQIVSGGASAVTVILPSASNYNYTYMIKRHSLMSGNVVIEGGGSEKVDGSANKTLSSAGDAVFLISDGTRWNTF